MRTVQINLLYTLIVAMVIFFVGGALVNRVKLLKRFSIPVPVVGGCIIAVILALADGLIGMRVSFDMSLKDSLLLIFFTTVGLAADARMLVKGGPKLFAFLLVCTGLLAIQNVIGIISALALDLPPVAGLLCSSITLAGGHGTGAAYATRFTETMNIRGAMELAMASATAGLIMGGIMGGPVAQFLIRRNKLSGHEETGAVFNTESSAASKDDTVTAQSFFSALFVILLCLGAGKELAQLMEGTGFILPDFLFCLLLGVLIRNISSYTRLFQISDKSVELLGSVSLSLFLIMALMSLRLLDLVQLAGPLLVILSLQTVIMVAYAIFVTFKVMGKNYDASVMAAGNVGFGMGTTAVALAVMRAVTDRSGPSPLAFLIVPMVGAFFMDITNAMIIQGFLALPLFGF
jgi:glutamate:Na+ symporter, ESS family